MSWRNLKILFMSKLNIKSGISWIIHWPSFFSLRSAIKWTWMQSNWLGRGVWHGKFRSWTCVACQHVPVIQCWKLKSAICLLTMVIIYPQHEDWLPSNSDMAHEDWLVDLRWPRSTNRHECSVSTSNTSCLCYISFNFIGRHCHCSLHWVYFCPITIQEAMSIYGIQVNQFM